VSPGAVDPPLCHAVATVRAPAPGDPEIFSLGWVKVPGSLGETVGSVTLPNRPTTLGEARGGLEMIADDAPTARWLRSWSESHGEVRNLVLRLPGGWFELCAATIALVLGAGEHYRVRFDRRYMVAGPAES
jgi:hypothetical protein